MVCLFIKLHTQFAVRQKVKDLLEFLSDDERIRDERKKAKKNQSRYQGIGNRDDFGGSSSHHGDYNSYDDESSGRHDDHHHSRGYYDGYLRTWVGADAVGAAADIATTSRTSLRT